MNYNLICPGCGKSLACPECGEIALSVVTSGKRYDKRKLVFALIVLLVAAGLCVLYSR